MDVSQRSEERTLITVRDMLKVIEAFCPILKQLVKHCIFAAYEIGDMMWIDFSTCQRQRQEAN